MPAAYASIGGLCGSLLIFWNADNGDLVEEGKSSTYLLFSEKFIYLYEITLQYWEMHWDENLFKLCLYKSTSISFLYLKSPKKLNNLSTQY